MGHLAFDNEADGSIELRLASSPDKETRGGLGEGL
jgi:hypothetical protein